MTAVNIILFADNIVIWTDGAVYNPTHGLLAASDKVRVFPHLRAALAVRGLALMGPILADQVGMVPTYDELIEALPKAMEWALHHQTRVFDEDGQGRPWQVLVTGWSEGRGRPESYFVESTSPDVVERLPDVALAPGGEDVHRRIAEDMPNLKPIDLATEATGVRIMEIQRELRLPGHDGAGVGCFAQATVIAKTGLVTMRVVKRWPDLVGEKIGEAA